MSESPHDAAALEARVRAVPFAVLLVSERPHRSDLLVDPATGELVLAAPPEVWDQTGDKVVFLPDESAESVQVLLDGVREPEPRILDRFQAHFPAPGDGVVRACTPESARWGQAVFDAADFSLVNPWHEQENALLREANADSARIRAALERRGVAAPETPVAVAIDPDGVSVRTRLGIERLAFNERVGSADAARHALASLLGDAENPPGEA